MGTVRQWEIMKRLFALALLCLGFVAISCEEEEMASGPTLEIVGGKDLVLNLYERDTLTVMHTPENIALGYVSWESSDERIAKVWMGIIDATGVGTCDITAKARIDKQWVTTTSRVTVNEVTLNSFIVDSVRCMLVGDSIQLTVTQDPEDLNCPYAWSSSDETVAKVDSKGLVIALSEGKCVVTVSIPNSNVKAQCQVIVSPVVMTSLQLSKTECNVIIGDTFKLGASFEPEDATYANLYWSSSDKSIAIVTDQGEVTAVGVGECIISVENKENALKAECKVVVAPVEMTSLEISKTKREIAFGEYDSFVLKATYEPSNTTYTTLYWSSSDESVAKVSDGKVEIIGAGSCVISVTNEEKTLTAECEVTVYMQEITSISCLEKNTLECGESFTLSATYKPSFVSPGCEKLYWESSDQSVATVNKETGEVTCVGVGECTITVGNTYNDVTAVCHLTVLPISVKGISLNQTSLEMLIGKTYKLSCAITPDNAANKEVKWESSDNSIATVDEDGTVTAINKGEATIKVTALDGSGCTAECVVEVFSGQSYVENKISIVQTGYSQSMGPWGVSYSYGFKVDNNGGETIYLKEVRGYGSSSGTISIDMQLAPGGSYRGSFNTNSIDWVFEIDGVEYIKRY